ncbi:MAG: 16S rRNA (cytosine(1402)-N(4))-methyltransferase, partial [Acidobacteriota bacterium]
AIDADPIELPKTEERLRRLGFGEDVLAVRRTNFAGLKAAIHDSGWTDGADFLLADLGISSMQVDDPARGFSFQADGPLDMRMNPKRGLSAAEWLGRVSVDDLAVALERDADEPDAVAIAEAIVARRDELTSTHALAGVVRDWFGHQAQSADADAAVRRTFQALRIEVNDEFGTLDALLRDLPSCLRGGGRAVFLTFHSGEDRRVKKALEEGLRAGLYAEVALEVTRAPAAEQRRNSRAKAAKLRWAIRS